MDTQTKVELLLRYLALVFESPYNSRHMRVECVCDEVEGLLGIERTSIGQNRKEVNHVGKEKDQR